MRLIAPLAINCDSKDRRRFNRFDITRVEMGANFGEDTETIYKIQVLLVDGAWSRWRCHWSGLTGLIDKLGRRRVLGQLVPDCHQRISIVLDSDTLPHNQSTCIVIS